MSNIWVAAADNNIELVKSYILSGKSTPNAKDPNGYTPIHAAVSYGNIELLEFLIKNGGDINIQDNEGDTPLHHVENIDIAKLLVEKFKADWNLENQEGQNAADYIEDDDEFPEVAQYLRSLNHDNPNESILDTLPKPDEVTDHQIRYSYENEGDIEIDIDDARRQQLKEIVESENPEERLTDFLKGAVHDQFHGNGTDATTESSSASKKRKD